MARVEERVSDGRVLTLIRNWLTADILHGLDSTDASRRLAARRGDQSVCLASIILMRWIG